MTSRRLRLLAYVCVCQVVSGLATLPRCVAQTSEDTATGAMTARKLGQQGPVEIKEGNQPILRYNYQMVAQPPEVKDRISEGNRIYAVARCDYIHPLYGPHGEVLTDDWVPDHPHHRGIYWAWPEVDWQGQRGDLHALQKVFARPTGKLDLEEGPDYAQVTAENLWRWEDGTPIVREQATLRAGRKAASGRWVDLCLRFTALGADVQVARRGQSYYGGLNVRLAPAQEQQIRVFGDARDTNSKQAWAHRSGIPRGGQALVGLTLLQHPLNPGFPGDWIQYPEIFWVQPTFPGAGTRHTITKDRPLELRYRLWIHEGKLEPAAITDLGTAYAEGR